MAVAPQPPFDIRKFFSVGRTGQTTATYKASDIAFAQGDPAASIFYIWDGKLKLTVISAQGKEAIVAIAGPGDFVGEGCLGGEAFRIATATAFVRCKTTELSKKAMARLLEANSQFTETFTRHLLARNARVEADLVDQLFNSSERRLARMLLLLANFGKEGKPEPLIAKISHESLAEMIGTTRSRVSFFMIKFRKLGLISYNGRIEVHAALLNALLHDDPHIRISAGRSRPNSAGSDLSGGRAARISQ